MKVEQLVDKVRTESEFTLKPATIAFLYKLENAAPSSIAQINSLIQRYDAQGIKLYKHLDFLFEILNCQLNLPADMQLTVSEFLASHPLDYTQMIRASYAERWAKLARQASTQSLSYHTSYHALEVALRTNIGAKSLGIFVEKDDKNQFLQYLLLTAAKYHDYEQWERGHLLTNEGCHTPEEQTATTVVNWLISDLGLTMSENPLHESMKSLLHYFVKLTIGPGTTILFGKDRLVNLSTIFYELESVAHAAGISENSTNQPLIYSIQAATEVLGAMDKVSAASVEVTYHQALDEAKSLGGYIRQLTTHKSHLIHFFSGMPLELQYYPGIDLVTNLEAGAIMNVAHTEMEIELHRDSPEAIFLRDYIKQGQALYKTSEENYDELVTYLHQVLTDARIADSFRHIYLDAIGAEQQFASKLPDICQHINLKLWQLGYVNERHESFYLLERESRKRRERQSTDGLTIFSPDLVRARSDSMPGMIHPFLEPQVFEREVSILGTLKDHIKHLEEIQQREIIQEILIVSICQPGIRYSNHPELIHKVEPPSPINCKTPLEKSQSSTSLGHNRYSSFSLNLAQSLKHPSSEESEEMIEVGAPGVDTTHSPPEDTTLFSKK